MFKKLRRLFSVGDPLVELARSGDGSLFREAFYSSELFVVSKAGAKSPDPAFPAFTYGPEGREILPVFSCREAAEAFVRNYVRAVNRVVPFVVASLEGAELLPFLKGTTRLTLNPLTDTELELPRELQAELIR